MKADRKYIYKISIISPKPDSVPGTKSVLKYLLEERRKKLVFSKRNSLYKKFNQHIQDKVISIAIILKPSIQNQVA